MTDIVARLRSLNVDITANLLREVAEIKQLQANADSLWQNVQRADEANKKLEAEIKRLRAELYHIENNMENKL